MLQYITFRVNLKVHLSNEASAEIILCPDTFFDTCPTCSVGILRTGPSKIPMPVIC